MTSLSEVDFLAGLKEAYRKSPKALALASVRASFSYVELYNSVIAFARYLSHLGLKPGDRFVAKLSQDMLPVALLAAFHQGLVLVPFRSDFANYSSLGVKLVITTFTRSDLEEVPSHSLDVDLLYELAVSQDEIEEVGFPDPDALARIFFTSGTTGSPKAIGLSARQMRMRAENLAVIANPAAKHMSLLGTESALSTHTLLTNLSRGQTYFAPDVSEHNLRIIRANRIESLLCSPAQLAGLLSDLDSPEQISSLKRVQVTGSAPSGKLIQRFFSVCSAQLEIQYGSAETGAVARYEVKDHSYLELGKVFPWAEVQIVEESGRLCQTNVVGQVRVRSTTMVKGYLGTSANEMENLREGWFYPGDVGREIGPGSINLLGRSNEVLNVGGVKISVSLIEEHVLANFPVTDCAVFSFEDIFGSPKIGMAIASNQTVPGAEVVESIKREFSQTQLNVFMTLPSIPMNEMGKVLRNQLAELAKTAQK